VFEPDNNGTVSADQWQQWDTLTGVWWATGEPGRSSCPQASPCAWADILSSFSDAAIHPNPLLGQFLVKSGSGWSGTNTTYTDAIRATVDTASFACTVVSTR